MPVPNTFASATSAIPLANLDTNFATPITLGNTAVQLGNTITTINSVTLVNAAISSTNGDATIHGLTVGLGAGSVSTNTVLGTSALASNSTGGNSTALGYQALNASTQSYNTAVGTNAGKLNTTGFVEAFGYNALQSNTTGGPNQAFGGGALNSNTTGSNNVAVGSSALQANTTASYNTAMGYFAGYSNSTGGTITAVGANSLYNSTSDNNAAFGSNAGYGVTSGARNTFLGTNTGKYAGTQLPTTGSGNTYVGYGAVGSSGSVSGEIVVCAPSSDSATSGKGSNTGFISPNGGGVYQGNNSTLWSVTSDERLKKNIVDNTVGLTAINGIKVRNFEYRLPDEITDLDKSTAINITGVQLGVIAQELQQVLPDCVKTESTGVMSVDSSNVLWHLVTAVQELSAKVIALQAKVGV